MDNMSLADIAAVTNKDNRDSFFGDGGFFWIVVLFLVFGMMGGGFWGNGNAGLQGALTRGEMADGFNTAEILRNQNGLMRDQFGVQRDVLENRYDTQLGLAGVDKSIMENRFASQQCCCETQKEILQNRYDAALQAQTMQAQQAQCCCDVKTAIHAEGEATRALINANTMQELRDNLQAAQLQLGNLSQTNTLLAAINKVPQPAYLTCSPYQAAYNPYQQCGGCNGYAA